MEPGPVGLVVAAAGGGTRLGLGDKAFVEVAGAALVVHALRCFTPLAEIGPIVVVAPPGKEEAMRHLVAGEAAERRIGVCAGGRTRRQSVRLGLRALPPVGRVLVHDAARPLASAALIRRVLEGVARTGAALPGLAPRDAVRMVSGGLLTGALDRRVLILAQTPQGFDRGLLEAAHTPPVGDGPEADDDAQLVWELGHPVAVVAGDEMNLKVTVPADLMLAELRLRTLSPGTGAPRPASPPGVTA